MGEWKLSSFLPENLATHLNVVAFTQNTQDRCQTWTQTHQ